jgi:hypothetical protein
MTRMAGQHMALKDQIPSFPELISARALIHWLAHGSDLFHPITKIYYSTAEQGYAEELATTKVIDLIKRGLIRATGRMSEEKQGSAPRWQAQRYKQHSKLRTYVEQQFWENAIFPKSTYFNTARNNGREYTDIMLVIDDCREHLADDIAANREAHKTSTAGYSTPYIELMTQAIGEFEISRENQPIKETLVEWFLSKEISGQKISRATAP